jgi:hypothetical protein
MDLATQAITPAGTTPVLQAAAVGGDKVVPGEHTFLLVKNAGAGPITVTIDDPRSVGPSGAQSFNPDLSVAVPNGGEGKMIGPLPASRFAAIADGKVPVTYSDVTSVTVAAFTA